MQFTVITNTRVIRINAKSPAHATQSLNKAGIVFLSLTACNEEETHKCNTCGHTEYLHSIKIESGQTYSWCEHKDCGCPRFNGGQN